jgi:hypothetical protein
MMDNVRKESKERQTKREWLGQKGEPKKATVDGSLIYVGHARAAKPSTPHDGTLLLAAGIPSLDVIRIHRQT